MEESYCYMIKESYYSDLTSVLLIRNGDRIRFVVLYRGNREMYRLIGFDRTDAFNDVPGISELRELRYNNCVDELRTEIDVRGKELILINNKIEKI